MNLWPMKVMVKPVVFAACLAPALMLTAGAFGVQRFALGADPVAMLLHSCGLWALRFLMITLAITPLRDLTRSVQWLRYRRMLGLFAFFYVALHFLVYILLDQSGKLGALWQDIVKRPYITIGMLGLVLLIPLALTSTAKAMRRLGRRWTTLHRAIYLIAILGVWHFWWQVKKDIREPLLYAAILSILLGYRLWKRLKVRSRLSVGRTAGTHAA